MVAPTLSLSTVVVAALSIIWQGRHSGDSPQYTCNVELLSDPLQVVCNREQDVTCGSSENYSDYYLFMGAACGSAGFLVGFFGGVFLCCRRPVTVAPPPPAASDLPHLVIQHGGDHPGRRAALALPY